MNKNFTSLWLIICLCVFCISTGSLYSQQKKSENKSGKSFEDMLNSDGTLKSDPTQNSSFTPKGYRMISKEGEKPRFISESDLQKVLDQKKTQTVPDDQYWDDIFGNDVGGLVYAIAFDNNGNLYVGGSFTNAGGILTADGIAKWNGSSWAALGAGINNGAVNAIAISGSDVYVGGSFTDAGGIADADRIAKWNGNNWEALGNGIDNGEVNAIAINGSDVYVGGSFINAGGNVNADRIAKWNGGTWDALETGLNSDVNAIAIGGNNVYIGGNFTSAGGDPNANYIVKWNGAWSALGNGVNSIVSALAFGGDGNLYAGGDFTTAYNPNPITVNTIAKWNGSTWSSLGNGLFSSWGANVRGITVDGNNVYTVGGFTESGGTPIFYIAKWDGTTWLPLGSGISDFGAAIAIYDEWLYVGGWFDGGGGKHSKFLARYSLFHAPTLLSPANNSNGISNNAQFRWEHNGAIQYGIEISTDGSFTTIDGASDYNVPLSLYTPLLEKLRRNTHYSWRVRAKKDDRRNYWSEPWGFTTMTPGINVNLTSLVFDDTKINSTSYKSITITNDGTDVLTISNLIFSSGDASIFSAITGGAAAIGKNNSIASINSLPISIAPGNNYQLTIGFTPTSSGVKTSTLQIFHNSLSTGSPISVSLTGGAFATLARIQVANIFDLGTKFYLTSSKDSTLTITNNSNDFLYISNIYFENQDNIFQVLDRFPLYIGAGENYNLMIRFNPNRTGSLISNTLHIVNSSLNNPDAIVTVRGIVIQSSLVVSPSNIDFGVTSAVKPIVIDTIKIQNYDQFPSIIITNKTLSGDVGSFEFLKNSANVMLTPGQTDTVILQFYPRTSGRKNAAFTISSNYTIAPNLIINLTGVGGDSPVLTTEPSSIDFGDVQRNEERETSLSLRNDGNLDLCITGLAISGDNKDNFSLTSGKIPDTIGFGQVKVIKIGVKGNIPVGNKNAQLLILNNDLNNSSYSVNLAANVRSNILTKDLERIIFDTTIVGEIKEAVLNIKNTGNITLRIGSMFIDGTYSQDFAFSGISFPFELTANSEKTLVIKFGPVAAGQRYARLVIRSDDPVNPEQSVILRGVGKVAFPSASISPSKIDFGKISIQDSVKKNLCIYNVSKEARLRIDSLYFDQIVNQPFSLLKQQFPFYIESNSAYCFDIKFMPTDKRRNYSLNVNILTSDPQNNHLTVELIGVVAMPAITTDLEEYINFGKVSIDSSKTIVFKINNSGDSYLLIDSIRIIRSDAKEFSLANRVYPIRIDPDELDNIFLTFFPKVVGVKDVKLKIYSNDPNYSGEIKILAEAVSKSSQTLDVRTSEIPKSYNLSQNYPNPFNPSTRIEYALPENSYVLIKIYNYLGQEIQTLVDKNQTPGVYNVDWYPNSTAGGLPSGIYFYKMLTGKYNEIKKMMYLR